MKKFIILLCFVSLTTSNKSPKKPTMNILELESSKVLPNFQGQKQPTLSPYKWNHWIMPFERKLMLERRFTIGTEYKLTQVSENSFIVEGSPIEWERAQWESK